MEDKLTKLYNTLSLIETKGNNTKIMAECLRYIEQMISEERDNKVVEPGVEQVDGPADI